MRNAQGLTALEAAGLFNAASLALRPARIITVACIAFLLPPAQSSTDARKCVCWGVSFNFNRFADDRCQFRVFRFVSRQAVRRAFPTVVLHHADCAGHATPRQHQESPLRLPAVLRAVRQPVKISQSTFTH